MAPLVKLALPLLGIYWLALVFALIVWRTALTGASPQYFRTVRRPVARSTELDLRRRYYKLVLWSLVIAFIPAYTSLSYARSHGPVAVYMLGILGFVLTLIGIFNACRHIRMIQRLCSDRDAKLAVAQGLEDILSPEHEMFHDIPTPDGWIDHLVVGPNGVFAIATNAGGGTLDAGTGGEQPTAVVERDCVRLSASRRHDDSYPLKALLRSAQWIQNWIAMEAGEYLDVRPVLVLPGRRVEIKKDAGARVINDRQLDILEKGRRVLQPTTVYRLKCALDRHFRGFVDTNPLPAVSNPHTAPAVPE